MLLKRAHIVIALGLSMSGAGCGTATLLGSAPVAQYAPANAMTQFGYTEKQIDTLHYEVSGVGTESTSPAWIEKIATARAAQIGTEEKLRYFKVQSVHYGVRCVVSHELYKGGKTAAAHYPLVTLDVLYAKGSSPPDATYAVASETYDRLMAEITKGPPMEDSRAIEAANKAQCGVSSADQTAATAGRQQ